MTEDTFTDPFSADDDDDELPFPAASPAVPTAEILATAKRMWDYTDRADQPTLINLFRVTDDLMPEVPNPNEVAAYQFFNDHPLTQLVMPGPTDLQLFSADAKKFLMLLASDTQADIKVITASELAYQLFLSRVALELAHAWIPELRDLSLLSKPTAKQFRFDPAVRYVSRSAVADPTTAKEKATLGFTNTTITPTANSFEDGQLATDVDFVLSPLTVADITYVLRHFAPRYEARHNVQYSDAALLEIATGSRGLLTNMPDPEKAILLLDQVGADRTLGTEQPTSLTKEDVRTTLADYYNSFPPSVLDKTTVRDLEQTLNDNVIDQPTATHQVAQAIKRASLGLNDPHKPIATFLFAGPTGVGKTELAKQLAVALYGKETEYIRFDMSEYIGREDSVYKLIGGAPIWRGSEQGGTLTNALKGHPNAILLFDEFEKASEQVYNLMLQILDEGRLTSGLGETISLTSNILIFTSNAGMENGDRPIGLGATQAQSGYTFSTEKFSETFPKELQNRFSNIVEFQPLSKTSLQPILDLRLKRFYDHFTQLHITLQLTSAVKDRLIDLGYDPDMGARPLERTIDNALMDPIADFLLTHGNIAGLKVALDQQNNFVVSEFTPPTAAPTIDTAAVLYVDGAYDRQTNQAGYGGILKIGEQTTEFSALSAEPQLRDFGGEMTAVTTGLQTAIAAGVKAITVIYDYQGIANWVNGTWRAKQPSTQAYRDTMAELQKKLTIHFLPRQPHENPENTRVTQLAKAAITARK